MQHDGKAFQQRDRGSKVDDFLRDAISMAAPIGGASRAVRGIMIGLPIAAALWALIFLSIWMV